MPFSASFANSLMGLVFQNGNIANVGDAVGLRGSTAAGTFSVALHTADPGLGGSQSTSEVAYTSYARLTIVRSAAGWTVTGASASNAALAQFPTCTGATATATHISVALAAGASVIVFSGALSSSLAISNTIQPQFAIGALQAVIA